MSRVTTLKSAEIALAKGEYRECISALESLLEATPLLSNEGGEIGILMITALIGKCENTKALSICEKLSKHQNDSIRQQAKQLISILNSPDLAKPKDWSITIPSFDFDTSLEQVKTSPNRNQIKHSQKPPTGPTKGLNYGFTIFILVVFSSITIFLSYLNK